MSSLNRREKQVLEEFLLWASLGPENIEKHIFLK